MQRFRSAALWLLFFAASICAQEPYPGKPVRIIVGYSAGGGNDLIVRVMAPRLSEGLGQRSEEHTSELQSRPHLVCRLLLVKKNTSASMASDSTLVSPLSGNSSAKTHQAYRLRRSL